MVQRAVFAEGQPVPGAPHPSWVVRERVAAGGFGEVWRAEGQALDGSGETISIAVKWFPEPEHARLFEKEAAAVEELQRRLPNDPTIVRMLAVNRQVEPAWIAYEFVEGGSLADALASRHRTRSWSEVAPFVIRLLDGVAAAHRAGVVHGDLSARNVLLSEPPMGGVLEEPRIVDFGLARFLARSTAADGEGGASRIQLSGLTGGHSQPIRGGTSLYMSPEQAAGEPATKQDDVYSLAVLLLHILTGDPTKDPRYARAALRGRSDVPSWLSAKIFECLESEGPQRMPDAARLANNFALRLTDGDAINQARPRTMGSGSAPIAGPRDDQRILRVLAVMLVILVLVPISFLISETSGKPTPPRVPDEFGLYSRDELPDFRSSSRPHVSQFPESTQSHEYVLTVLVNGEPYVIRADAVRAAGGGWEVSADVPAEWYAGDMITIRARRYMSSVSTNTSTFVVVPDSAASLPMHKRVLTARVDVGIRTLHIELRPE